jgi:hypothetical protein
LDRKKIEQLVASARTGATEVLVDLAEMGETLLLRTPENDGVLRIGTLASKGEEEDQEARGMIALLRFAAVDDAGRPLLRSYEEAAAFMASVPREDFPALVSGLGEIGKAMKAQVGSVTEGKASSRRAPRSSRSTTRRSSTAAGSRARSATSHKTS